MADNNKIQAFKNAAISQGHDPQEVEAFAQMAAASRKSEQGELDQYAQNVASGMPLEYVPQENRSDVYNDALSLIQGETDEVSQSSPYSSGINLKAGDITRDIKEAEQSKQDVRLYSQGAIEWDQMSDDAKEISLNLGFEPKSQLSAEQEKKLEVSKGAIQAAENVLDVVNQIERGELIGEQAQDALNFAGSQFNKTAFEEGGKALTESEQALLQGAYLTTEVKKQNVIQKLTGKVPPQTGNIVDDPSTIRTKMQMAINVAEQIQNRFQNRHDPSLNLESEASKEKGMSVDQAIMEKGPEGLSTDQSILSGVTRQEDSGMFENTKEFAPGFVKKAGTALWSTIAKPIIRGAKGYAQLLGTATGVVALPAVYKISPEYGDKLADTLEEVVENKYASPQQTIVTGGLQTLGGVGAAFDVATLGQGSFIKQTVKLGARNMAINLPIYGIGEATKAARLGKSDEEIKEAAFRGATGQGSTGPFVGIFGESPQAEAADIATTIILPIVGQKLLTKFIIGKGMEEPNTKKITKKIEETFDDFKTKKSEVQTARFRENLKLYKGDRESLTEANKLADRAIAMTKSRTLSGMAKEMPKLRSSSHAYINTSLLQFDDTMTVSSSMIKNHIMNNVRQTSAAQANPKSLTKFQKVVDNLIKNNSKNGVMKPSDVNKVRLALNQGVKSAWFRNGTPVTSPTEEMYSMKWTGSISIQDLFANEDILPGMETINKAIKIDHYTRTLEPILSQSVLASKAPYGQTNILQFVANVIKSGFSAIVDPLNIMNRRSQLQDLPEAQDVQMIQESISGQGGGLGFSGGSGGLNVQEAFSPEGAPLYK